MSLGKRISELRIKNNMTQDEFAKKINYTPQAISKWENDLSEPKIDVLRNISKVFNVKMSYLLGEQEETYEKIIDTNEDKKEIKKSDVEIILCQYEESNNEVSFIKKISKILILCIFICIFIFYGLLCYEMNIIFNILISASLSLILLNTLYKINFNNKINKIYNQSQENFYLIPNLIDKIGGIFLLLKLASFVISLLVFCFNFILIVILSLFLWRCENGE